MRRRAGTFHPFDILFVSFTLVEKGEYAAGYVIYISRVAAVNFLCENIDIVSVLIVIYDMEKIKK